MKTTDLRVFSQFSRRAFGPVGLALTRPRTSLVLDTAERRPPGGDRGVIGSIDADIRMSSVVLILGGSLGFF